MDVLGGIDVGVFGGMDGKAFRWMCLKVLTLVSVALAGRGEQPGARPPGEARGEARTARGAAATALVVPDGELLTWMCLEVLTWMCVRLAGRGEQPGARPAGEARECEARTAARRAAAVPGGFL